MESRREIVVDEQVESPDRENRLLLLLEAWEAGGAGLRRRSYDFLELVWQHRKTDTWKDIQRISKEMFQSTSPHPIWVSGIHSLDPAKGTAIIRVAEGDAPIGSKEIRYSYSWREWSLNENLEVKFVRVCEEPWELFEANEERS